MPLRTILKRASNRGVFRRDPRGLATVEFALVLPFTLVLFTGAIMYGDAIAIDRKVTLTTRTVTDLVTQVSTISQADLTTAMAASAQIVAPYSATPMTVTVSEVQTDSAGKATVTWSQKYPSGAGRPKQQVIALPSTIDTANATFILGEVTYTYTPAIGYRVTGPMTLSDQTYMSPRVSAAIPLTP